VGREVALPENIMRRRLVSWRRCCDEPHWPEGEAIGRRHNTKVNRVRLLRRFVTPDVGMGEL